MTRGQDTNNGNNQQTSGSGESIPDAILTLTKNVLGQNVTKTIEPLIKRVGDVDHQHSSIISDHHHHRRKKKRDHSTKKEHLSTQSITTIGGTQSTPLTNSSKNQLEEGATTESSPLTISSSVVPGKLLTIDFF